MIVRKKNQKKKSKSKSKSQNKRHNHTKSYNQSSLSSLKCEMNHHHNNNHQKSKQQHTKQSTPQITSVNSISKKQLGKNRQIKSKNKLKQSSIAHRKIQPYEFISIDLVRSNTNSEIQFSNYDESTKNIKLTNNYWKKQKPMKNLYINCDDQLIIKQMQQSSSELKLHHKNNDRIENFAALKIQKVFRGYLTRKLLEKCIIEEQEKLQEQVRLIKRQKNIQIQKKLSKNKNKIIEENKNYQIYNDKQMINNDKKEFNSKKFIFTQQQVKNMQWINQNYNQQSNQFNKKFEENNICQISQKISSLGQSYFKSPGKKSSFRNNQSSNKRYLSGISSLSKSSEHAIQNYDNNNISVSLNQQSSLSQCMYLEGQKNSNQVKDKSYDEEDPIQTQISQENWNVVHQNNQQKAKSIEMNTPVSVKYDQNKLEQIRLTEQKKWKEVILMLNAQIQHSEYQNEEIIGFMRGILDLSRKNLNELVKKNLQQKKCLQQQISIFTPSTVTEQHEPNKLIQKNNIQCEEQQFKNNAKQDLKDRVQLMSNKKQQLSFKKKKPRPLQITNTIKGQKQLINQLKSGKSCDEQRPLQILQPRRIYHQNEVHNDNKQKNIAQRTIQLKKYLLHNIQDEGIQEMMKFRQDFLQKKQNEEMLALHNNFKTMSNEEFILKLTELTEKYQKQKNIIQQTRKKIEQGYKATLQLVKDTVHDANFIGLKTKFCHSMKLFKGNRTWRFDKVMIDELQKYSCRKRASQIQTQINQYNLKKDQEIKIQRNNFTTNKVYQQETVNYSQENLQKKEVSYQVKDEQEQQQNQESCNTSSLSSDDEKYYFKKVQPYSFDVSQLQDNSSLLEDTQGKIILNGKISENNEKISYVMIHPQLKKQVYQLGEDDSEEEEILFNQKQHEQSITNIVNEQFNKLVWQCIQDIYTHLLMKKMLKIGHDKCNLKVVSSQQRNWFVNVLHDCIPQYRQLKVRLNQKMYPTPRQKLIGMRDEYYDDNVEEYYEVGEYEFILDQKMCNKAIQIIIIETQNELSEIPEHPIMLQVTQHCNEIFINMIKQSQLKKQEHNKQNLELRKEIMKFEINAILDAWNEEIIKQRDNTINYRSINNNYVMQNLQNKQCKPIKTQQQFKQLINRSKIQLREIISEENTLQEKLSIQNHQYVIKSDPLWIIYSHEALQYSFQLTHLIEDILFDEVILQLYDIAPQNSLYREDYVEKDNLIDDEDDEDRFSIKVDDYHMIVAQQQQSFDSIDDQQQQQEQQYQLL